MIEEGFFNNNISKTIINSYLSKPKLNKIDALILACTHYPLIKKLDNDDGEKEQKRTCKWDFYSAQKLKSNLSQRIKKRVLLNRLFYLKKSNYANELQWGDF